MNLLLLLSALLGALTGVDAGGIRAPVAAERVAQRVAIATATLTVPRVRYAPPQAVDPVAARRIVVAVIRWPRFDIPAFASRRRE